jgi:hypothetical protein
MDGEIGVAVRFAGAAEHEGDLFPRVAFLALKLAPDDGQNAAAVADLGRPGPRRGLILMPWAHLRKARVIARSAARNFCVEPLEARITPKYLVRRRGQEAWQSAVGDGFRTHVASRRMWL